MSRIFRRRPSPAMVVALIALFVALGGSSYAALRVGSGTIIDNSVRSRDLRNSDVRSGDLRNNEVRAADLRNNDVRTGDLRNNDIRTWDIRNNEIRGWDIRNNSLTRGDLAFNTLTGGSIDESSLGTVPKAASVGGLKLRNISYRSDATSARKTILDFGGLRLTVTCSGGPEIKAESAVDGGQVRYFRVEDGAADVQARGWANQRTVTDATDNGQVQVAYMGPDGGHVNATLSYDGGTSCSVQGYAVAG